MRNLDSARDAETTHLNCGFDHHVNTLEVVVGEGAGDAARHDFSLLLCQSTLLHTAGKVSLDASEATLSIDQSFS